MINRNLIISILVAGLVFVICYSLAYIYAEGAFVNWKPLGTPSPQVSEMISIEFDQDSTATIYLGSVSGNGLQKGSPTLCTSSGCWVNVNSTQNESNPSNIMEFSSECPNKFLMMKSPPGDVEKCVGYTDEMAGSHFIRDAYFVILKDGSTYLWQFIPRSRALLIILIGLLASVAGGLVTFSILQIRQKWANSD